MNYFKRYWSYTVLTLACLLVIFFVTNPSKISQIISPLQSSNSSGKYEVFGFAPYWNLKKLDNINFNSLSTLAYFDMPLLENGDFDTTSPGYQKFETPEATALFNKAHGFGSKVVLTITIMQNDAIETFLESQDAQKQAIDNTVSLVKQKGLDGINVDVEYVGSADSVKREQFSSFVKKITDRMHSEKSGSKVTVSVYAASAKYKKLYDIAYLGKYSDGIFMMAYDFATKGADTAMPTAPLYGYKEGKYWYDISTAVDDFLKVMPANKLILGLPWYGYDYPVTKPSVNAKRDSYSYWYKAWVTKYRFVWKKAFYTAPSFVQTYKKGQEEDIAQTGWDNVGKVGWKAYKDDEGWRMYFLEDEKSLGIKYDFAKEKKLGGVGIWALGFDEGRTELWNLLADKFGKKLARTDKESGI